MKTWLITGANGNLGRNLLARALAAGDSVIAVVRSDHARRQIEAIDLDAGARARLSVGVVDYQDAASLSAMLGSVTHVVHLVGILKESARASYRAAHEGSTDALVRAMQGSRVEHVTYLSIVGAEVHSANACLASKARAAAMLHATRLPCCELRVPMVLGVGDYASLALRKRATAMLSFGFRMSSKEQPIFADDVVAGVLQAGRLAVAGSLDLGGPEVLSRAALTHRAAAVLGHRVRCLSLPLALGMGLAWLFEKLPNPPLTRAMLEVLDHDDVVDSDAACARLDLDGLTSLDDTLRAVL